MTGDRRETRRLQSRRVRPAVAVAVVLVLCVAGCANVPTGGQVVTGKPAEKAERVDDPYVRLIPVSPQADWGPTQLVSGFLTASASFDDGHKVYIEFPSGIGQGEMPPLFVIGSSGNSELVNYRARQNYYVVDRLFAAAELRLGDKDSEKRVRIVRTDGRPGRSARLF